MWNGVSMSYVTEAEAKKMERAKTHERVKGRDANTLAGPDKFKTAEIKAQPKAAKASNKPPRRARGVYQTTQMKAG